MNKKETASKREEFNKVFVDSEMETVDAYPEQLYKWIQDNYIEKEKVNEEIYKIFENKAYSADTHENTEQVLRVDQVVENLSFNP